MTSASTGEPMRHSDLPEYPGSRWWKFDFHNHTPASSDYYPQEKPTVQPRDWLLAYMRAGVDCVAVTDHNTGEWIDRLKLELKVLTVEQPEGYRSLTIFPGVEITSSDPLHILALFDPTLGKAKIDALMGGRLKISDEGVPNHQQMCSQSASIIADEIRSLGGLAIAAHVEQANGLLRGTATSSGGFQATIPGRTVEDVLSKLDAVEFQSISSSAYEHFKSKLERLACVAGSDAPHRLSTAGTRTTWVKMTLPSIEGLRLALLDPDSAIRRSEHCPENPQKTPSLWMESITLRKLHLRRLTELKLPLHPAYNAVIGGRGSGKSTVIEAARLALARDNELEDLGAESSIRKTFEAFRAPYDVGRKTGMTMQDSQLEVILVEGHGENQARFRCTWQRRTDGRYQASADRWEDPNWVATNLSPAQIRSQFPVKIFSQKQILELAQQPQNLLSFVDDSIREQKQAWTEEFSAAKQKLLAARLRVRTLKAEISKKPALTLEHIEIHRKAQVFARANFAPLLKSFQRATQQRRALLDFHNLLGRDVAALQRGVQDAKSLASTELTQFTAETPSELQAKTDALALRDALAVQSQAVTKLVAAMQNVLDQGIAAMQSSSWRQENQAHLDAYAAETARLKDAGISSAQEAAQMIGKAEQLATSLEQIAAYEKELPDAQKYVVDSELALTQCREKLTGLRQAFIQQLSAQNNMLQVTITAMGDGAGAETGLRQVLRLPNDGTFSTAFWFEEGDGNISGLLWDLIHPIGPITIGEQLFEMKRGLVERSNPIFNTRLEARLMKRLEALPVEALDELAAWFPEDAVTLKYRAQSGGSYKPISAASAGQKTAAMLSFLLLHGDEPLLLDQPEDDLDNALVSELVVSQLRENKKKRQLLVVTHNANIVVNGDAELVMTMEFNNGQIDRSSAGGLQERAVREDICRVMEGGRPAFQQRYRRILEDLEVHK